jgi:hypothetical protein
MQMIRSIMESFEQFLRTHLETKVLENSELAMLPFQNKMKINVDLWSCLSSVHRAK